jgi:hypothetical protein
MNQESFTSRLTKELSALSWNDRNDLLVKIGQMELRMRNETQNLVDGQNQPIWKGLLPEVDMLGTDVVVPTDHGMVRGRVVCFGVLNMGGAPYERSIVVHVPSSGTQFEVPASVARLASSDDSERILNEMVMAGKLEIAHTLVQNKTAAPAEKIKKRGQKDPKLIERMIAAANSSNTVKNVDDCSSNYKITGINPDRRMYVFKNQLRVDVSGFSFDHIGMRKISDAEAKDMHLGKVRGQMIFDDKESAFAAFEKALQHLADVI